jgi:hypothetical protein
METSREDIIETPRQLTPETANLLIGYLYFLIDDIQFRFCPLNPDEHKPVGLAKRE